MSALAAILTAMAVVIGLAFNAWSVGISQKQVDLAADQAHREEQSQIEDRIGEATKILNDKDVSIGDRVGAIDTLRKIIEDSEFDTAETIAKILKIFIRNATEMNADHPICEAKPPTEDIQDALNAIFGLRLIIAVQGEIDLDRACLWGANLNGANLRWANLRGANLSEAQLFDANLVYANLEDTIFTRASLENSHLDGATLTTAKLSGTRLSNASWSTSTSWPPELATTIETHSAATSDYFYVVQDGFVLAP